MRDIGGRWCRGMSLLTQACYRAPLPVATHRLVRDSQTEWTRPSPTCCTQSGSFARRCARSPVPRTRHSRAHRKRCWRSIPRFAGALHRIEPGDELIVLTWLHLADRRVLQTHPTGDERIPLTGVFRTRSPDRPNPIGVHRVTVTAFEGPTTFRVGALEAIDGTPIVDLKIVMDESRDE